MAFTTKKSLLARIKHGDDVFWQEFYEIYRPLIRLRGSDFSLSEDEKEELVQLVILEVFKDQKRFLYDPAKGRFRDYLRKIINHRTVDIIRKRSNTVTLNQNYERIADDDFMLENLWLEEWQSFLLTQAMNELRNALEPTTFQAFELYAIKNQPPQDVSCFLDISVSSVYVAKQRAIAKLREIIKGIAE